MVGFVRTKWGVYLALMVMGFAAYVMADSFESETKMYMTEPGNGTKIVRGSSDDTVRPDPLDSLRKYRGGYDITNKHYWSSTLFTGVPGYAIGLLWLLCGALYEGYLIAYSCTSRKEKINKGPAKRVLHLKQCSLVVLVLAAAFTVLAIVASALILGENAQFYSRARKVVSIIIRTADEASGTLFETTGALKSISTAIETSNTFNGISPLIESTSQVLDSAAANILKQAKDNRKLINNALKIMFITSTVTVSLAVVAALILSISGFLRQRPFVEKLLVLCWILTSLCWFLFGAYFFIDNFASDTCTALKSFQQDPYNNTLSSVLPCKDMLSAKSAMSHISEQIYDVVKEVNTNLKLLQGTTLPDTIQLCNPFSGAPNYFYQPDNCPTGTVRIGEFPKVLKPLTCSDADDWTCIDGISPNNFEIIQASATSVQIFLDVFPGMQSLVECKTIKDAFTEIISKQCKPLRRTVRIIWAAMLFLSILMVLLILTWILLAFHAQDHHFSDERVKAKKVTAGNTLEFGDGQS